ncbi:acyltransferase [Staphylococcus xylosus]|uniref:acyltransferase family protein n=1 Tax=Staphylococcus xylosus TaxID=1288 RepID=UPI001642EF85|nr:acyltransferase family protein [Staphylococcus xylosus]MEB7660025.1 acyltransferase [Staphylococcus xylosus]MEB7709913.1 acyltransferase [Staphylococcus xylosus]MEB7785664.1 acyltransferase [Staphylococcus xylosus]UBV40076.1 acyltransferase [Staphylococcus xylosus]
MNQNKNLIDIERKFRPEIEGLRIVAALLVAIYHIWFGRVSGGVDVFFVISGFLITTSIISTINKTGEYKFWPYISKLLKRLLPSALFIVLVTLVLSFFFLPLTILTKTIKEALASIFYYQNWQLAFSSTDYLDANQMKSPLEHFWAMSIQGQFYLIWFLLFTFVLYLVRKYALSNGKKLVNFLLTTIFIVSFIYSIYLTQVNQPFAYFITFTRVWEFALGGLLCVNLGRIKINRLAAAIIGWIGLVGLILTGALFDVSKLFPGYIALWPMTCALLIVLSGNVDTKYGVKRFLALPIMTKLGGISFGIYLWHWVLLSFYKFKIAEEPGLISGVMIILLSIGLSFFMTRFIEAPIRNGQNNKKAFSKLGKVLSVNLILIVSLFVMGVMKNSGSDKEVSHKDYPGVDAVAKSEEIEEQNPMPNFAKVFDDLPQSHLDNSNQNLKETDVKVGEYGKTKNYKATIALVGSSHSEHWLGGFIKAADKNGYRILNITRSGTRFSTGYEDDSPKGKWVKNVNDYLQHHKDIDLVVSHATSAASDSKWVQNQMINQLNIVKDEYDMDVLAIRDIPTYDFSVPEEFEKFGEEKTIKKMNDFESQKDTSYWQDFAENDERLYKFDPTEFFKVDNQYAPVIGNINIYRDMDHMTNTYSESFGNVLAEKLKYIIENKEENKEVNLNNI